MRLILEVREPTPGSTQPWPASAHPLEESSSVKRCQVLTPKRRPWLAARVAFAAKVGFLHSKSKQPVLKIGLKSSVWSQAEMKSDTFGQ